MEKVNAFCRSSRGILGVLDDGLVDGLFEVGSAVVLEGYFHCVAGVIVVSDGFESGRLTVPQLADDRRLSELKHAVFL